MHRPRPSSWLRASVPPCRPLWPPPVPPPPATPGSPTRITCCTKPTSSPRSPSSTGGPTGLRPPRSTKKQVLLASFFPCYCFPLPLFLSRPPLTFLPPPCTASAFKLAKLLDLAKTCYEKAATGQERLSSYPLSLSSLVLHFHILQVCRLYVSIPYWQSVSILFFVCLSAINYSPHLRLGIECTELDGTVAADIELICLVCNCGAFHAVPRGSIP